MLRVLSVELLKLRRKLVWLLVVLGPLGVASLQAVNFLLRHDYYVSQFGDQLWDKLIDAVVALMLPVLFVGLSILASMAAGIEHQTNAWKMTLALPVSRAQIFAGKLALNVLLLLVSSALLAALTIVLGLSLGFGGDIPLEALLKGIFYTYAAVMPFVALQSWLSVILHNQALPLTIGIIGTMVSMFGGRLPDWMPWKWPLLLNAANEPLYSVAAGVALGAVLLAAGMAHFARRDVK